MNSDDADAVPRYRQIAERIRRAVGAGQYAPGGRLPPEGELARQFGVSRGTLRQALGSLTRAGLLETIRGHGTFVKVGKVGKVGKGEQSGADQAAGSSPEDGPTFGDGRGRVIGVVIPSVARTRIPDLIDGAEAELRAAGYTLILASSGDDADEEARQIRRLVEGGVDGLLVYPVDEPVAGASNVALLRELLDGGRPLVLIDRYLLDLPADAVVADNIGGAYTAVRWLLGAGHERIGLVSTRNLGTSSIAERRAGYWWALQRHGRSLDPRLTCTELERLFTWPVPDTGEAEQNRRLLRHFLTSEYRPDAVFAVNDTVAFQVLESAGRLGLRVPEDLAVVGFDNLASPDYAGVPLTTVDQPRYQIGATAARIVLQRIAGREARAERVVLGTRLIVRGSCGGESRRAAAAAAASTASAEEAQVAQVS
jgi:DNA-binding LacI/PurR family transcriptional regulator/DNA-binding transcriptional regulator YhcF (GntR family)